MQRDGRRTAARHFIVITRPAHGHSRLGITTSRKVGNAPARNRIRRLVREYFRRQRLHLGAPRDILVIARPAVGKLSYAIVHDELSRALRS